MSLARHRAHKVQASQLHRTSVSLAVWLRPFWNVNNSASGRKKMFNRAQFCMVSMRGSPSSAVATKNIFGKNVRSRGPFDRFAQSQGPFPQEKEICNMNCKVAALFLGSNWKVIVVILPLWYSQQGRWGIGKMLRVNIMSRERIILTTHDFLNHFDMVCKIIPFWFSNLVRMGAAAGAAAGGQR